MAASYALKDAIVNHFFRNSAQVGATTWYVALFTSDPGLNGEHDEVEAPSEYARQAVTFTAPLTGVTYNSAEISFGVPDTAWGTVTHWGVSTHLTDPDFLVVQELDDPYIVVVGEEVIVPAGKLKVEID